ncbi:MAG TPA: beta-galactosidase [Tepidisphaeraceae bacterium]|jgi:beta-galactosidase|nr:beta-galactosidase [Tepidisphaeraceae bacterium]
MKIGTYYYPEQWPRQQWERDFDNIAKLGLQIVHMAEFAWFDLEPKPGEFKFDWLSQCVEMAKQRKLDVILCTPTAAPPIWLSQTLPQTLPVYEGKVRGRFGGRRHYNPLSPEFQDATRRIVAAMADRFGDHPSVIGWQIDNEYSNPFDQSEVTHAAFQKWLRKKYGDIQSLNRAWGNQFWNTYYTDFEQILMPPSREPKYGNPHQCLDASRFWSWAFAAYNRIQSDILKARIGNRFITTNFMSLHADCDPQDMDEDITLSAWDSYPVTGREKEENDENYRIADPAQISLCHDQMASYQNRWGLMELQPGHVNWSGVPVRVYPGAIRLWIWTAFAHGSEFVTTYRFRQPRFGVELFHDGLVGTDGVTPSAGGREFSQVVQEMRRLDLSRVPKFADEPRRPTETVGLVLDFEQLWYYLTLPQARRWNQSLWLASWYAALSRLGVRIQILRPGTAWPSDLPLIVAPGVQMIDQELVSQFDSYARAGGNLVLTCRTGLMDRTGQLWEGPWAAPILPMIGASIDGYDSLRDDRFGQIKFGGSAYTWGVWGDQVTPNSGTEVLATYADQFYAGAAAVTRSRLGKGTVSYFGVFSEQPLVDAFVESLAKSIGPGRLSPRMIPNRVQVLRRGPYRIALNYQDKSVAAPASASAKFLIGSANLVPADVAVWEE